MYLSDNLFQFQYKNHFIKLVSVRHNKRDTSVDTLKEMVDYSNKRKTCYLLETDYRKNKIEIRKKFGDHTTQQFMGLLLKEEKETKVKKCIKGWDIRQSILTQEYQDYLYGMFYKLPFGIIENYYLPKLVERKVKNKNIDKNIELFINHNYKQSVNHFKRMIENELNNIKNIIKKENNYNNIEIFNLINKYKNTKKNFEILSNLLFHSFSITADLFILETVLSTNINTDYIIIMGEFHFNDTINFVNLMKKDNLF